MRLNSPSRSVYLSALLTAMWLCTACGSKPPPPDEGPLDPPGWNDALALPSVDDANPDPHVLEVTLEAKVIQKELRPGQTTELWTYNGLLPGPTFRAHVGDRVIVHFTNHLPEATTIHWHGLRVPASMDGTDRVQNPIQPGESFTYDFVLKDAGTYWYHPHMTSSHQVNAGLYGAFIVDGDAEPDLGAEQVFVLSDILLNADGTLASPTAGGWLGDYFGREGNVLLINGRVRPELVSRNGRPQRWRVINASRTRYYWFEVPQHRVFQIASDGGFIPSPVAKDRILMAPAERLELLVIPNGTADQTVTITWLPYERGFSQSQRPEEPMLDIRFSALPALRPPDLPKTLRDIAPVNTDGAMEQLLELTEENVNGQMQLGINGVPSWDAQPLMAQVNTTQVWTVRNTTDADHPFHLHGFFFQVLDQDGAPPPFREWKDTQNIPAKKTVRIAIPFDDRAGMWMFHCHILDHADLGMMGMVDLMQ